MSGGLLCSGLGLCSDVFSQSDRRLDGTIHLSAASGWSSRQLDGTNQLFSSVGASGQPFSSVEHTDNLDMSLSQPSVKGSLVSARSFRTIPDLSNFFITMIMSSSTV